MSKCPPLPKYPHYSISKMARLILFFYSKRWYLVIQDLSSKFIYCIYTCLFYIRRQRTCIYTLHLSFFLFFLWQWNIDLFSQNRDNCCRPTSLLHWLLFLYSAWNNNFLTDTNFLETRNDYVKLDTFVYKEVRNVDTFIINGTFSYMLIKV